MLYSSQECGAIDLNFYFSSNEPQDISVGLRDSEFNLIFFDIISSDSLFSIVNQCLVEDCYSLLIEPSYSFIFDQDVQVQVRPQNLWYSEADYTLALDSGNAGQWMDFPVFYADCTTGLNDHRQDPITFYVNDGILEFLELIPTQGPYHLRLYDIKGSLIYNNQIHIHDKIRLPQSKVLIVNLSFGANMLSKRILNID